jgi:spermidine synthase
VLWVRELGLIVGSTAQAAALAIAIFFTGIASGGWFWGRRSTRAPRPLATFGVLEIAVAATALGHIFLLDLVAALPATLHPLSGAPDLVDLAAKVTVATLVLLPPSFLMGGTLPMMAEHVLRPGGRLGQRATLLYGVNTGGATIGAIAAGFLLPPLVGYRTTYLLAVLVDLTVGVVALMLARRLIPRAQAVPRSVHTAGLAPFMARPARSSVRMVWVIALASGTATLIVEVLWTRLFSQVLQNSVQTYALVLATFLLALSCGALVASALARLERIGPELLLAGLLLASGAAVAVSGPLFAAATEGVRMVGAGLGWNAYLATVALTTLTVMLVPGTVIGTVLPFLLRLLEREERGPGELIGRLVAINTVGAIAGSLVAGFVLLPWLGAARALLLTSALYALLAAVVLLAREGSELRPAAGLASAALASIVALLAVTAAPGALDPAATLRSDETLIAIRDGPAATVTVVERRGALTLRVNRSYILGGTASIDAERDQIVLPMLLHPDPRRVFVLGMGTGITAGATLAFDIEEVVVCELIDDVIVLAREHFAPWAAGLFDDPRATVVADDGRSCLQRSDRRYDLMVSDLFVPWQAGTGSLYTRELYEAARARLDPGGLYVQWLPLYQIGREELDVVAATMDAVFDDVVVLRGDLFGRESIVGLVGSVGGPVVLDPDVIASRAAAVDVGVRRDADAYVSLVTRLYAGSISNSGIVDGVDVDTDARALVELRAPRTHRAVEADVTTFVVGAERERFYSDLRDALAVDHDPALALLDGPQRDAVRAGHLLSEAAWERARRRPASAGILEAEAAELLPSGTAGIRSPSRALLPPPQALRVLR